MSSKAALEKKKQVVNELTDSFNKAAGGIFVDYKGISVADDTKMRAELRAAGVKYAVIKNTMLRFALKDAGMSGLDDVLAGTTAMAYHEEDQIISAKILCDYADKKKIKVKAGFVDKVAYNANDTVALSKLPSKEVLVAQVLAGFNAPISGFVNVLNGNVRGLVCALNAIAQQKA